jgi:hypothetical protein
MVSASKNSEMLTNVIRTLVPRPVRTWLRSPSQFAKYLIDSMALEFGMPTHIEIDFEDHEAEMPRRARETLIPCFPFLFVGLHNNIMEGERGDPDSVLEQRTDAGYTLYTLRGTTFPRTTPRPAPVGRLATTRFSGASSRLHLGTP